MKKQIIILATVTVSVAAFYYHYRNCQSGCCTGSEKAATSAKTTTAECGNCGKTTCGIGCEGEAFKAIPSCNLNSADQNKRFNEVIKPLFSQATVILEMADGWDIIFQNSPEMLAKLNEIAAFERKCCASFTWEVREETTQKQAHLKVSGSKAIKEELRLGMEQFGLTHLIGK
ncbi:MAG: hypothetical protein NW218_18500 [Saprospiraceae bacterium]|nr:hypothetical protein [Saprospiraceae bacterium]